MQTTSKTGPVRAKATPTPELSLLSKLGRVIKLESGRGTTVDDNPEGCQGTEGDLPPCSDRDVDEMMRSY